MTYFTDCQTVEAVKAAYRKAVKQTHPDLGGSEEAFKQMFNEYTKALKRCNGQTAKGSDGKKHTYKYNEETEKEIHAVVDKLLRLRIPNIDIYVIGLWLWLPAIESTKAYKDKLKELGLRWHKDRKCWYWRPAWAKVRRKSSGSLNDLAHKYGCDKFRNKDEVVLAS